MGVKASVATIFVNFDKPSVEAGLPVNGKAFLSVNQSEVSCVSIGCRIIGQESTKVTYSATTGSGDSQLAETSIAHDARNFLNMCFMLVQVHEGRILQGQYEFPFTFTVPASAPATMSASTTSDDYCNIAYSMEVWLDRPGMLRWDIRNTRNVTVVRPVPMNSKAPLYMEPSLIDLHSCYCFKRGNVLVGGAAESSMLYAGANTSVKYAAQNNSTVPIKAIEVSLLESVRFHAQGHYASTQVVLFKRRMSPAEARLQAPLGVRERNQQHGSGYDPMSDLQTLSDMLASDRTTLQFTVPSAARSSCNGSLIRVHHVLSIQLFTTFGTENPTIAREIQMFSSAPCTHVYHGVHEDHGRELAQPPTLPPGWAPFVAPPVVLPTLLMSRKEVTHADHTAHNDQQPVVYSTATAETGARADGNVTSCAELLNAMVNTYDPCSELEVYLRHGNRADDLQPEDFYLLFRAVRDAFDQQRLADTLAADMTCTSCAKVARATAGALTVCKREVAEKLLSAGEILDRDQNAHLVKSELSVFEYMTVEKYFR